MEENQKIRIDLSKLPNVGVSKVLSPSGQEVKVVCIPVEENNIFLAESGAIYIEMKVSAIREEKQRVLSNYKATHIIKQMLSKQQYSAMSDDDKKNMPIIGNIMVYAGADNAQAINYVQTPTYQAPSPKPVQQIPPSHEDLPF